MFAQHSTKCTTLKQVVGPYSHRTDKRVQTLNDSFFVMAINLYLI